MHKRFNLHRPYLSVRQYQYVPWYDDTQDFNTNAPSYYDFLARYNKVNKLMTDLINQLLRRDIEFLDTSSIDFSKIGSWIDNGECLPNNFDDVIKIKAEVILSKLNETKTFLNSTNGSYILTNAIKHKTDGIFSPNYDGLLQELFNRVKKLEDAVATINQELTNIKNDISNINQAINTINNAIEAIQSDITKLQTDLTKLTNRVTTTENAIKKIVQNLYDSGAVTSNDINTFTFKTGRNIATGNINFFGGTQDGASFIRTNSGSTENDVTAGI